MAERTYPTKDDGEGVTLDARVPVEGFVRLLCLPENQSAALDALEQIATAHGYALIRPSAKASRPSKSVLSVRCGCGNVIDVTGAKKVFCGGAGKPCPKSACFLLIRDDVFHRYQGGHYAGKVRAREREVRP